MSYLNRRSPSLARARVFGVLLTIVVGAIVGAGAAHASTAYRYWTYYVAHDGGWQYSQRGPAAEHPVDGEVQGWRFAIQADRSGGLTPRVTPSFQSLCSSTPAKDGQIRVGIVLDFGLAADAPAGERPAAAAPVTGCVSVPTGASGADVLVAAVGSDAIRIGDAGLVCGIDGYPKHECAPSVRAPAATPTSATPTPTPSVTPETSTPAPEGARSTPPVRPSAATTPTPSRRTAMSGMPAAPPSTAGTAPSASARPVTTLADLRTPSHHDFPWAAVIGGALVVALGGAAVWRGLAGRR